MSVRSIFTSILFLAAVVTGCGGTTSDSPSGATPGASSDARDARDGAASPGPSTQTTVDGGASLAGSIPCGQTTCSDGQACVNWSTHGDGGAEVFSSSHAGTCVTLRTGCTLQDCTDTGTCTITYPFRESTCGRDACSGADVQRVEGRYVLCYGA